MELTDGAAGQHHGHHGHNDHGQHPHAPAVTAPKPKTGGALRVPLLLAARTVRLPEAKCACRAPVPVPTYPTHLKRKPGRKPWDPRP